LGGPFLGGEVLIDLIAQHIPITAQDAAIIFTYAIGTMAIRALMKLLAIADIKRNQFSHLTMRTG